MRVLAGLAGLALLLAACGGAPQIKQGNITEKQHEPARDWTEIVPIPQEHCYYNGRTTTCTTTFLYLPVQRHSDERWIFALKDCTEEYNKCRTGKLTVDESTYNQYDTGDWFPNR